MHNLGASAIDTVGSQMERLEGTEVLPGITWIFQGSGTSLKTGTGFGFCRMFGGLRFNATRS